MLHEFYPPGIFLSFWIQGTLLYRCLENGLRMHKIRPGRLCLSNKKACYWSLLGRIFIEENCSKSSIWRKQRGSIGRRILSRRNQALDLQKFNWKGIPRFQWWIAIRLQRVSLLDPWQDETRRKEGRIRTKPRRFIWLWNWAEVLVHSLQKS